MADSLHSGHSNRGLPGNKGAVPIWPIGTFRRSAQHTLVCPFLLTPRPACLSPRAALPACLLPAFTHLPACPALPALQGFYPVQPEVTFLPGDELGMACNFNSSEVGHTVHAGHTSSDEMCNLYMMLYSHLPFFMWCLDGYPGITVRRMYCLPVLHVQLHCMPVLHVQPSLLFVEGFLLTLILSTSLSPALNAS